MEYNSALGAQSKYNMAMFVLKINEDGNFQVKH
jgi:hypothetical protein